MEGFGVVLLQAPEGRGGVTVRATTGVCSGAAAIRFHPPLIRPITSAPFIASALPVFAASLRLSSINRDRFTIDSSITLFRFEYECKEFQASLLLGSF